MGYDSAGIKKAQKKREESEAAGVDPDLTTHRALTVSKRETEEERPRVLDQPLEQRASAGIGLRMAKLDQRQMRRRARSTGGF